MFSDDHKKGLTPIDGRTINGGARRDAYRDAENLWQALMSVTSSYAVSAQTVHLPAVYPPELPQIGLTVLLQDDGKSRSVVRVPGGGSLAAGRLKAVLHQKSGGGYRFRAGKVDVDGEGVRAEFPSLQQLRLATKGKLAGEWYVELAHPVAETDREAAKAKRPGVYCGTTAIFESASLTCEQTYGPVLYVPAETRPEAPGNLIASVTARKIVTTGGLGSVTVGLQLDPGVPARSAYVKIEGAEITAASGGEIDDLGRLKVPTSGRVTLTLRNAAAGGKVTLRRGLFTPDGSKEGPSSDSHVLDVVASDAATSSGETGKPAS